MSALRNLDLGNGRVLPARLLSARFTRAGGPGGQNVNKVATRAVLTLDLAGAAAILGGDAVARLRARLASRLDADGNPRVAAGEHREQGRNLAAAVDRMESLLARALAPPKPRHPTRPTAGARERRLAEKRRRSELKRLRAAPEE